MITSRGRCAFGVVVLCVSTAAVGCDDASRAGSGAAEPEARARAAAALPFAGTLVTLASQQTYAGEIAVDATNVYWTAQGALVTAPLRGGRPTTLATFDEIPAGLAVDATRLYASLEEESAVVAWPLGGGALATLVTGQGNPSAVAVSDKRVYWANGSSSKAGAPGVYSIPLEGGPERRRDGPTGATTGVATDGVNVYWTEFQLGGVYQAHIGDAAVTTLASGLDSPWTLVVHGANVFFTGQALGQVWQVPVGGGPLLQLAAGAEYDLAVDDANVYFTNGQAGLVLKVPVGGGAVTTLATGQAAARGIAVDATSVYWATPHDVKKLTPK